MKVSWLRACANKSPARVHITSSPSGGEIYVDGKFYGNTPSEIVLYAGEHVVKVVLSGKGWTKTVQIAPGEIRLTRTCRFRRVHSYETRPNSNGNHRAAIRNVEVCPVGPLVGICPRRGIANQQLFIAYWPPE
jgi:PEGA domain